MEHFVMGAIAMACFVAGLYFLRFWRDTHDRLFAIFAVAFWLLGATRIALAMVDTASEESTYIYWLRFAAFLLILLAVIDKNRARKEAADDRSMGE